MAPRKVKSTATTADSNVSTATLSMDYSDHDPTLALPAWLDLQYDLDIFAESVLQKTLLGYGWSDAIDKPLKFAVVNNWPVSSKHVCNIAKSMISNGIFKTKVNKAFPIIVSTEWITVATAAGLSRQPNLIFSNYPVIKWTPAGVVALQDSSVECHGGWHWSEAQKLPSIIWGPKGAQEASAREASGRHQVAARKAVSCWSRA